MSAQARPGRLEGLLLIEPVTFNDSRGFFLETWRAAEYAALGIAGPFVQDNAASSRRGVLRGLHFQQTTPQGKLVTVLQGSVFDVAVDLRTQSPTFGQWEAFELNGDTHHQLWIPPGFAHGYQVTSDNAILAYKCTAYYSAADEVALRWDDPDLAIPWPIPAPLISAKDQAAATLATTPRSSLF